MIPNAQIKDEHGALHYGWTCSTHPVAATPIGRHLPNVAGVRGDALPLTITRDEMGLVADAVHDASYEVLQ
jgi:hypothetical protein